MATIVFCAAMFAAEYVAVNYCHLDRVPYSRMTLTEDNDFADMGMFPDRFDHFHSPEFFSKEWGGAYMYPAPLALIYRFFFYFDEGTNWFLGVAAFLFVAAAVLLFLTLRRSGLSLSSAIVFAAVSVAFSYPMYFALNRANMEIFVWMLTGSGVLFFVKERPWWAATFLGIAGACKFYPFFYLGLLLVRRKYGQFVFSLLVGAALSIISMFAVAGSVAAGDRGISSGLEAFRQTYVLHRRYLEAGLDHSIFGLIKKLMIHVPPPEQLAHTLSIYLAIATCITLAVFFLRIRKLPIINQVLFITVACIALPPLSSDYTLLHLYTPWIMVVLFAIDAWSSEGITPRGLWPVTICMAILLSSQTEFILHGERLNGQIKCFTLLLLGAVAAIVPLQRSRLAAEMQAA